MGFVSGLFTLLLGFVLIRGLGQGSLGLVSLHVVNIWFVRRRGLAVGLTGLGIAASTGLFPLLIQFLIDEVGWRNGYMLLGALLPARRHSGLMQTRPANAAALLLQPRRRR